MDPVLPVESVLPELRDRLQSGSAAVLVAPPGAGKTTRVPLALLDEPWLAGRRILLLEPRRLAARSVARYMAASLGEPVGERVGYRVHLESRVGPRTRIEVITEGILIRMLQADPALEGIGLLIFDEFHERSLQADLGLALSLQSQGLLRTDLRILVMSATLEAEPAAALLGGAPVLRSEGRSYPVETHYLQSPPPRAIEPVVARTVLNALRSHPGDLLVFLPGAAEIRRVEGLLQEAGLPAGVFVVPLHGSLSAEAQDRAIRPAPAGQRRVVLASAVAETSLTVEGVGVVIDSGLMRVPRFSPRTGMSRLETMPVSRASADQRRGRAGRLGPGVCYRLWTEQQDRHLLPQRAPEILEADLLPLALELAAWGAAPDELSWLDPPPRAAMAQARDLLTLLGALDDGGSITPHGRRMAALGVHPRLGHMLLKAAEMGLAPLACDLAALLGERDLLRSAGEAGADLRTRLRLLRGEGGMPVDEGALRRVRAEAAALRSALSAVCAGAGVGPGTGVSSGAGVSPGAAEDAAGLLLAFAYPDRIAQARGGGRFRMQNGRGAFLPPDQPLALAPWLVAAELADQGAESRIFLGAEVDLSDLQAHFGGQFRLERQAWWDGAAGLVRARQQERFGALLVRESAGEEPDPERLQQAMLAGVREEGLTALNWTRAARQLQQRLRFMHGLEEGWPDVSDAALVASLPEWLGPHLYGIRRREELQRLPVADLLLGLLTWEQRHVLDEAAPTHLQVPSGSRHPIDYSDPHCPVLAVRLQEVFGWSETPRIGRGRVPLTLHLLSPAQRPVQVTRDLASFWRGAYFEVRKELRGRYPKHYWPEDPLTAVPTSRTRPRGQ